MKFPYKIVHVANVIDTIFKVDQNENVHQEVPLISNAKHNRRYSYSRYWTRTRLVRWNITKMRLMSFPFEKTSITENTKMFYLQPLVAELAWTNLSPGVGLFGQWLLVTG